ncbi:MAG TPA: lytic transglycosylase domain-containing protein [Clostridia bacterium]|nr:lytic transglycosylase domain-containing protein [Clostridia bacterium]
MYKRKSRTKRILITLAVFIVILAAGAFSVYTALKMLYPIGYPDLVSGYSEQYGLDPYLITAVINVESNFKPDAVSHANARGLMQISEKTGKWAAGKLKIKNYKSSDLFEPEINIRIGCWYLSQLYKEFGDMDLALAAYNGGSGNVNQWLKDESLSPDGKNLERIPFPETEQYIRKVKKNYTVYKKLYENQF